MVTTEDGGIGLNNSEDLTLLHETTGREARLIATASLATRLSAAKEIGLRVDKLYGLLSVGLPSDKHRLARVREQAFGLALQSLADMRSPGSRKGSDSIEVRP